MTTPTQAQIDAAEMAFIDAYKSAGQRAAIIAVINATIKRCAMVADKMFYSEDARAIAREIRKLKD